MLVVVMAHLELPGAHDLAGAAGDQAGGLPGRPGLAELGQELTTLPSGLAGPQVRLGRRPGAVPPVDRRLVVTIERADLHPTTFADPPGADNRRRRSPQRSVASSWLLTASMAPCRRPASSDSAERAVAGAEAEAPAETAHRRRRAAPRGRRRRAGVLEQVAAGGGARSVVGRPGPPRATTKARSRSLAGYRLTGLARTCGGGAGPRSGPIDPNHPTRPPTAVGGGHVGVDLADRPERRTVGRRRSWPSASGCSPGASAASMAVPSRRRASRRTVHSRTASPRVGARPGEDHRQVAPAPPACRRSRPRAARRPARSRRGARRPAGGRR